MVREAIERIPFPLCGVALGTVALGNLLDNFAPGIRYVGGVLALVFLLALVAKLVMVKGFFRENMENPISASVSGTFPMTVMQLAALWAPWLGWFALGVWWLAVSAHILLIIYFTITFLFRFKLENVHATWFVAYVGLAVASVTAPAFGLQAVGTGIFWFGFIALVALFCLVTLRYGTKREVADAAKPLICIYTAPFNLCIVGYLNSVADASPALVLALWSCACVLYVVALVNCILCLRREFYPSYAAFTFPFVISAMASFMVTGLGVFSGAAAVAVEIVAVAEILISTFLVVFVICRYGDLILSRPTLVHAEEEAAYDEISLDNVPEGAELPGYPRAMAEEAERVVAEKTGD